MGLNPEQVAMETKARLSGSIRLIAVALLLKVLSGLLVACGSGLEATPTPTPTPAALTVDIITTKDTDPTSTLGLTQIHTPTLTHTLTPTSPPVSLGKPPVGVQVGNTAADFTLKTLDDQPLTLGDLLAQEKPFILYFFATW